MTSLESTPNGAQTTLDLRISDPVSLLNEIARRYISVERILMEYVDNPIDDAEELYRANAESYPYEIRIEIVINRHARTVTIRDNCRGMKQGTLERIVGNVGESQKKGLTWVNGRFGFGVHAFRASAEGIRFRTKHADDDHLELQLRRDQHQGIRRPWSITPPFPSDSGTGTDVLIGPFEDEAFRDVTVESVKSEIEHHFERLLARPSLVVTVSEVDGLPSQCEAFDYAQIKGEDFYRTLDLDVDGRIYPVEVCLKVAEQDAPDHTARFFARGRRVNTIAEIRSFISKSHHRTAVWGHPQLLGYIEVGEAVQPVITRDDFSRSAGRKALYDELLGIEDDIKEALDRVNEAQRDSSLTRLEDILAGVLDGLARQDRLLMRSELIPGQGTGAIAPGGNTGSAEEPEIQAPQQSDGHTGAHTPGASDDNDTALDPDRDAVESHQVGTEPGSHVIEDPLNTQGTRRPKSGFDIRFHDLPPNLNGVLARSKLVDGTIYINTGHRDFKERMMYTRKGRPRFTDRLGAYLAATVSVHYKDQLYQRYGRQPERRDQLFDEQVEFMCRFETALRPCLPHLEYGFGGYAAEAEGSDDV